jgi:hypothetical protein
MNMNKPVGISMAMITEVYMNLYMFTYFVYICLLVLVLGIPKKVSFGYHRTAKNSYEKMLKNVQYKLFADGRLPERKIM